MCALARQKRQGLICRSGFASGVGNRLDTPDLCCLDFRRVGGVQWRNLAQLRRGCDHLQWRRRRSSRLVCSHLATAGCHIIKPERVEMATPSPVFTLCAPQSALRVLPPTALVDLSQPSPRRQDFRPEARRALRHHNAMLAIYISPVDQLWSVDPTSPPPCPLRRHSAPRHC